VLYLPAAISGGNVQITATLQNSMPSGLPALSFKRAPAAFGRAPAAFRRVAAASGATGITFLGLYWAAPITLSTLPSFTFALPSADIFSGVDYYLAIYDPSRPSLGWEEGWEGPATVSGTTLTFSGGSSQYTFAGSLTYWLAVFAVPQSAAQPTPAPSIAPTTVPTQAPPAVSQAATQSDAFVGSVGVNTHFTYPAYNAKQALLSSITSLLVASNIRHIRDGLVNEPVATAPYYAILTQLGAQGVGSDLISSVGQTASQIQSVLSVPGVEAIEGPNEYDLSAATVPNWAAQLSAFQSSLFATVRASSASLSVVGPALTTEANYAAVGSLSADATYGNTQGDFAGRNPGTAGFGATDAFGTYGSIPWQLAIARQTTGSEPIFVTETGYDDSGAADAVPAAVKARYLMRTLLEFWNAGAPRTYIYELVDEPGATSAPSRGLIDSNGNPKLAYTAVTNFLAQLTDPGPAFSPSPLGVGIYAASSVHHTLLQKRDGSYRLLLWVEAPSWNPVTDATLTVAPQTVELSFASAPSSISAVSFNDSGTTTASNLNVASSIVTLSVTDDVTIVTVHP